MLIERVCVWVTCAWPGVYICNVSSMDRMLSNQIAP